MDGGRGGEEGVGRWGRAAGRDGILDGDQGVEAVCCVEMRAEWTLELSGLGKGELETDWDETWGAFILGSSQWAIMATLLPPVHSFSYSLSDHSRRCNGRKNFRLPGGTVL
jgi:hypothetical protein